MKYFRAIVNHKLETKIGQGALIHVYLQRFRRKDIVENARTHHDGQHLGIDLVFRVLSDTLQMLHQIL